METITIEIDVLPILIKNISEENAAHIPELIEKAAEDRELKIRKHYVTKDGLIILISGNIGNYFDTLITDIANINCKNRLDYYKSAKLVKALDKEEYKALTDCNTFVYSQLNDDLSKTFR